MKEVVKSRITKEEFAELGNRGRRGPSPQVQAIRALQPGEGIVLDHGSLRCGRVSGTDRTACSIQSAVALVRLKLGGDFLTRHTKDGDIAVYRES